MLRRRRIVVERKKLGIKLKENLIIGKRIAFIIPITSRRRNYKKVEDTDFCKIFYQSFMKTCGSKYQFSFYLGYDHDDPFYTKNIDQMHQIDSRIKMIEMRNLKGKVGQIWSILAQKAVDDGNDWLYQIGDDIEILDKNWEDAFVRKLIEMELTGVVGPNDINTGRQLITQSFVHFTHLLIFNTYYPPEINNWYIDDWISIASDQYHFHEFRVKNSGGEPRYSVDDQKEKYLAIAANDRKKFLNIKEELRGVKIVCFKSDQNKLFIHDNIAYLISSKVKNYDYEIDLSSDALNYGLISQIPYMNSNVSFQLDKTSFIFNNLKDQIVQNNVITEDDIADYFFKQNYKVLTRKHINVDKNAKTDFIVFTGLYSLLKEFFEQEAYKLGQFTLITIESDFFELKKEWLETPNLKGWYTWNKPFSHPKLFCIPIGLNKDRQINSYLNFKANKEKDKLLLINFSSHTHKEREEVLKIVSNWDFVTKGKRLPNARTFKSKSLSEHCEINVEETNYDYFNYLSEFKFVLSPRGTGVDCHRTWEALYVGVIPIVRSDCIDELYEDLPILVVDKWEQIDEDFLVNKYQEIQMKKGKGDYNMERITLRYWLHKIENKNMKFITYANNLYYNAKERLLKEAKEFGVFNSVKGFGPEDLSPDFRKNYTDVLSQKRGAGYWIWKLDIIEQSLKNMIDGQILVYLDAGCSFNIKGKKRFDEYIEMLKKSKYDILSFQMQKEKENQYTTKEIFEHLLVDKKGKEALSGQYLGGVLFMKKGKHLRLLLDKYRQVLEEDMYLFTDKYNKNQCKEFKDNRHDQSVFSLIRKIYGSEVIIGDETYFDDFKSEEAMKYPIHALRSKI